MRLTTLSLLVILPLAACGRKGARAGDFDSATGAALATGNAAAQLAATARTPHVQGLAIGRSLDRHDMIFGGTNDRFRAGDSVLVSVRTQYVPTGADVSGRIRFKNATRDSSGGKAPAADSAGVGYVGLRFLAGPKWVAGDYSIEIFIDGKFQLAQDFKILQ